MIGSGKINFNQCWRYGNPAENRLDMFLLDALFFLTLFSTCCSCATTGTLPVKNSAAQKQAVTDWWAPDSDAADELRSFFDTTPEWKGARIVTQSDIGGDYDREWFRQAGYRSIATEDFNNDGDTEIAALVIFNGKLWLLILRSDRSTGQCSAVYKAEILMSQAMLKTDFLGGTGGEKCIIIAGGPKGPRSVTCSNNNQYTVISL